MDSIRVSEAPDTGSIPVEATQNSCTMFYAYVLKSINHDFFYKGHCENPEARLLQHNSGITESIRPYVPFESIYKESFTTREMLSQEKNILKLPQEEDF